jgi:radical SAM protein (TIGR01212 family)
MMVCMGGLFRSHAEYLRERYGGRVYRVSVDAGFSCPNRGPDRTRPGCLYCDSSGARAPYLGDEAGTASEAERLQSVRRQIETAARFLRRRYGAEAFLLYFQAFTNTLAPVEELKRLYDSSLDLAPFRELIVSTRPDCIDEAKAELLASYRARGLEVWVELGLQSACAATLRRMRRGHTVEQFHRGYRLLQAHGVRLAVHLIFGLPGEGLEEILQTMRLVAGLMPDGVKIHNLHIPAASPLAAEYRAGEIAAPCASRHLDYVVRALELLAPETVILRLTCDTPAGRLAAPLGFWPKARFYQEVREKMRREQTWQGRLWPCANGPASPPLRR